MSSKDQTHHVAAGSVADVFAITASAKKGKKKSQHNCKPTTLHAKK